VDYSPHAQQKTGMVKTRVLSYTILPSTLENLLRLKHAICALKEFREVSCPSIFFSLQGSFLYESLTSDNN